MAGPDPTPYRFIPFINRDAAPPYTEAVRVGDLVRLPDDRPGTVTQIEFLPSRAGLNVVRFGARPEIRLAKVVSVVPFRPKKRLFGIFKEHPSRFADAEIEKLEFIASGAEIEGIDPEAF